MNDELRPSFRPGEEFSLRCGEDQAEDRLFSLLAELRREELHTTAAELDQGLVPARLLESARRAIAGMRVALRRLLDDATLGLIMAEAADRNARRERDRQADLDKYEGPTLAATLLVRAGMMEPAEAEEKTRIERRGGKRSRRPRLNSPAAVVREIQRLQDQLNAGEVSAADARTRVFLLQTALVAIRMQQGQEPPALPPAQDQEQD